MAKLSFDTFTKKIYLKATTQKLYRYWASSEGICTWFLRKANYTSKNGRLREPGELCEAGDSYTWQWHNWDEMANGEVLHANGKDFLEISFESCKVSIHIEDKGTARLLILKQYEIKTDEESKLNIHYGCSNGWTFWLTNLKAYLEHGILLNEMEFDLRNNHLAGFEYVNM